MKTDIVHIMRATFLLICAAFLALPANAADMVKWREGITAGDQAFWSACKEGRVAIPKDVDLEEDIDYASNVRAEQGDGSFMCTKKVYINYDVITLGQPVYVTAQVLDNGVVIPTKSTSFTGDIGERVPAGRNKRIVWDAGADYDGQYSDKMQVQVRAFLTKRMSTWAEVKIEWSAFGGRDLDVCGYWIDRSDVKVGFSYGTGSTAATYRSTWRGDNTGSGPETIRIGVVPGETLAGVKTRKYRIHCNYYGAAGSSSKATISVTCKGVRKAKTITASNRNGRAANTSDPYVTISFDDNGNLISID